MCRDECAQLQNMLLHDQSPSQRGISGRKSLHCGHQASDLLALQGGLKAEPVAQRPAGIESAKPSRDSIFGGGASWRQSGSGGVTPRQETTPFATDLSLQASSPHVSLVCLPLGRTLSLACSYLWQPFLCLLFKSICHLGAAKPDMPINAYRCEPLVCNCRNSC